MGRLGFFYNMNTCLGCGACQLACKGVNGLVAEEFFRRVQMTKYGPYSGACNHCEEAACVAACPTGAMYKAEDGTTQHDDGRCIGCGSCIWNCPYGAASYSKTRGVSQKCTSCADRRARGEEPACVAACPTKSIRFGDTDELCAAWRAEKAGATGTAEKNAPTAELPFLPEPSRTKPHLMVNPSKRLLAELARMRRDCAVPQEEGERTHG